MFQNLLHGAVNAMHSDCIVSQLDSTIDDTVTQFLKASRLNKPPVDSIVVADRLGFAIVWDERQIGRARIAMVAPGRGRLPLPTIFLRPDPRPERVQWALAHEIGEAAIANVLKKARLNADQLHDQAREQCANLFARRLLLPSAWFASSAREFDFDLLALKQIYSTASHELIAWRMLDLPHPAIVSLFDHGRLQSRRSNLSGQLPPVNRAEANAWRQAHGTNKSVRLDSPTRIDAWPIHEPAWRREIVRTEVAECGY
jgi:uncharacterized protein DUF955